MRGYEALVIFKTAGTDQDIAKAASGVGETMRRIGGQVQHTQPMGRRKLAYRIARQTEGYYYLMRFQAPTQGIAELGRLLRLGESVVRFLILADDHASVAPSPSPSRVAAGAAS
jgi:small subunit ribosomal protein S6